MASKKVWLGIKKARDDIVRGIEENNKEVERKIKEAEREISEEDKSRKIRQMVGSNDPSCGRSGIIKLDMYKKELPFVLIKGF